MKILFIGSSGSLSLIPLKALIKSGHHVCAFAFDQKKNTFDVLQSGTTQSFAFENAVPFIKFDKNYSHAVAEIKSHQPDIILVSCYARLLPEEFISIAKRGCFNIHPSLLPAFRGATPVFWQFRQGVTNFGVTLHRVSNEFDSGNIVSQASVKIDDGLNYEAATKQLALLAAELALKLFEDIENNNITEVEQDNTKASYYSYPANKDYEINSNWTARRIFNFIKAYQNDKIYFLCQIKNNQVRLTKAISYQSFPYDNMKNKDVIQHGNIIKFACQEGYIECQFKAG